MTTHLAQLRMLAAGIVWSFVALSAEYAQAQEVESDPKRNFRAWYMYFGDHPVASGRWGFHFDGQLRMVGVADAAQQVLLRPAVNLDLSDRVQVSGGYAYVRTYPIDGPAGFDTPEHRIWQQFLLRHPLGAWNLMHRARLEQRFVGSRPDSSNEGDDEHLPDVSYTYRNRFRYFVKGTVPLGDGSRQYLALYNEVMVNFGSNRGSVFDQNRSYAALGFRLGAVNLEVGYLLQIVNGGSAGTTDFNHVLQVAAFSSAPLFR